MRKRIVRVAPVQLGKVAAVFYGLFSIPLVLIMVVVNAMSPQGSGMAMGFMILLPVFYVVFGFIVMAIGAWLYNLIVKWTGGIEYETQETGT